MGLRLVLLEVLGGRALIGDGGGDTDGNDLGTPVLTGDTGTYGTETNSIVGVFIIPFLKNFLIFHEVNYWIIKMPNDSIFRELTIIEKLGSGGYGTVYKCRHKSGNDMALKIINMRDYGIPSLLEPVIMATLRHPTLNPAINITSNSTQLLILQLLAQHDLRQWRKENFPTESQLCKWTFDLIQAIHILHQCGLIHCDIKSQNILVFDNMTIRLSDFSIISGIKITILNFFLFTNVAKNTNVKNIRII